MLADIPTYHPTESALHSLDHQGLLGIITTTLLPLGLARLAAPKKSYEKIEEVEDDASPA